MDNHNKPVDWKITAKEGGGIIRLKHIDPNLKYSVFLKYDVSVARASYIVRPIVEFCENHYIVDVALESETLTDISIDKVLGYMNGNINDTYAEENHIAWPTYGLNSLIIIDKRYPNDIDIYGLSENRYEDVDSVRLHMAGVSPCTHICKCNGEFFKTFGDGETKISYNKDITLEWIEG